MGGISYCNCLCKFGYLNGYGIDPAFIESCKSKKTSTFSCQLNKCSYSSSNGLLQAQLKIERFTQFIGVGYNLVLGNPKADRVDPGFGQPVFQLTYSQNQKTDDNLFLIPDGATTRNQQSCSYQSKTSQYTGRAKIFWIYYFCCVNNNSVNTKLKYN